MSKWYIVRSKQGDSPAWSITAGPYDSVDEVRKARTSLSCQIPDLFVSGPHDS